MILDISKYCSPKNASVGIMRAINDANDGDTIFFDVKASYHLYKDYSQKRHYHMTNTDSFKTPEKYFAILFEDKKNIIFDGNDCELVIHGNICALSLVRCSGITLKNFTIRYNAPTNIELTVLSKKLNKVSYSVPEGTTFYTDKSHICFFEQSPFTKKNYYEITEKYRAYCTVIHNCDYVRRTNAMPLKLACSFKKTGKNTFDALYLIPPPLKTGDTVALSENRRRDTCGIFFWESSNITSENITVNYMHGFGWLSQMCENLNFSKLNFVADNAHNVSSFADCIHICGCKGSVKINDCFFTHPHDDAINIHGAFLRLEKKLCDNAALFSFVHKQQGGYANFFNGDFVRLYNINNLKEIGEYQIKSHSDNIDDKTVILEFEQNLPHLKKRSAVIENTGYNPSVEISGCKFKSIPTRGILITTDKPSSIHNNVFENIIMPDIYISCDCKYWYESGPCKCLDIYENVFSKENPVLLEPLCRKKPVPNIHENINIYNNTIYAEK